MHISSQRAAVEAQERVDHLESNIEDIQKRTGGFFYPNEIQAETLGILPRGPNFRYIYNDSEVSICIYLSIMIYIIIYMIKSLTHRH